MDTQLKSRIKEALAEEGLDMKAASRKAGKGETFVRDLLERGRSPSVDNLLALAKGINRHPAWLLTGEDPDRSITRVPLVSWVSAGHLKRADGVMPADIERHVPVANLGRGEWIALEVSGDSMDRVAPDGSIIIVDRSDDALISDRFYVFSLENGEATFKQWRREPRPMLRPYSTNLDHLAIPADYDDVYVVGRVRKVVTDL